MCRQSYSAVRIKEVHPVEQLGGLRQITFLKVAEARETKIAYR